MPPRDVEADVVVVAGDIAGRLSRMGRSWLEGLPQGRPVVLVAGNHDYWGGSLDTEIQKFRERLTRQDVHILDGDSVEIGDVRFVGGTLWTDYECYGDPWRSHREANEGMNDVRRIRADGGSRRAQTQDLLDEHLRQRDAITALLETPFTGATVVVTHHAPSPRSLRHGRVTEALDGAYASDLEALIRRTRPELWVHGHVHKSQDYVLGNTRVVANPKGYTRRFGQFVQLEHEAFDDRLVIDVVPHPRPMPDPAPEEVAAEGPAIARHDPDAELEPLDLAPFPEGPAEELDDIDMSRPPPYVPPTPMPDPQSDDPRAGLHEAMITNTADELAAMRAHTNRPGAVGLDENGQLVRREEDGSLVLVPVPKG